MRHYDDFKGYRSFTIYDPTSKTFVPQRIELAEFAAPVAEPVASEPVPAKQQTPERKAA